jgi:hypothetical protein
MASITHKTLGKCTRPHPHGSDKQVPSANHDSQDQPITSSRTQSSTGGKCLTWGMSRTGMEENETIHSSEYSDDNVFACILLFSFLKT